MTEEAVRQALIDWLGEVWAAAIASSRLVSDTIRIGIYKTGGPKLPRPCAIVHTVTHGMSDGRPTEAVSGNGEISYINHRRDNIQVHVLTSGPENSDWDDKAFPSEILEVARESIRLPTHVESAAVNGIAVIEMLDPVDATEMLATEFEAGAIGEFVVAYRRRFVDTSAGSIERIIGTVDLDGIEASVDVIA